MAGQRVEIRLPDFELPGAAVAVSTWHVAAGQRVVEGDRLVELVAGDATIDVPAPASGTLVERIVHVDEPLAAGQLLAVILRE